jgi:hypothetical protein
LFFTSYTGSGWIVKWGGTRRTKNVKGTVSRDEYFV